MTRTFEIPWPFIAFTLPIAAAATFLILRTLWAEIGSDRDLHREVEHTHRSIAICVVSFVIALHLLVVLNLGGMESIRSAGPRIVIVLLGAVFIAVGNLLPRTRPNLALGIRTSRTLGDRHLWIRLHRACGFLSVGFGVIIVAAGTLLQGSVIGPVIAAGALSAVTTLLVMYRRQRSA